MSYTYLSFQKALALEMIVPNANTADPNFVAILPTIIDYAEQRCYRELDCLHAEVEEWFTMAANVRNQSYAAGVAVYPATAALQILIPERVNIAPATPLPPNTVGAAPLTPVTVDYIDAVYTGIWPAAGPTGPPEVFAPLDDQTLVFGPTPDQPYNFMIHGKARPVPLYSAAPNDGTQMTFLTAVLPDLFLAAAMVAAMGYRHNFGAQSDDPRSAVSWEGQYNELLGSAKNEETRKRFLGYSTMSSYSTMSAAQAAPAPAG